MTEVGKDGGAGGCGQLSLPSAFQHGIQGIREFQLPPGLLAIRVIIFVKCISHIFYFLHFKML